MGKITFISSFDLQNLEQQLLAIKNDSDSLLEVNLEEVSGFDIDALLFFLVILSNERRKGRNIKLTLPNIVKYRKARDFLCRWKFKKALRYALNIDLSDLLPFEQIGYFDDDLKNYNPTTIPDQSGQLTALSSVGLLEIIPITELCDGNMCVSKSIINDVSNRASLRSLMPVIKKSLNCSMDWAMRFGNVLIYQALLNAYEHPNATVAFIAMAKDKNQNNLIISVADNGLTIAKTIERAYKSDSRTTNKIFSDTFKYDSNKIAYATEYMTSRKPIDLTDPDRGMGLYYMKTMAAEVRGSMKIRCASASVYFLKNEIGKIIALPQPFTNLDRGNLITIVLPLAKTIT